jgi:hypothetical protein
MVSCRGDWHACISAMGRSGHACTMGVEGVGGRSAGQHVRDTRMEAGEETSREVLTTLVFMRVYCFTASSRIDFAT